MHLPSPFFRLHARPHRRALVPFVVATLSAAVTSCGGSAPPGPPNIVLISVDTLRPDHLSVYGYERNTSPNIDALAAEGLLFESAYCPMPVTGPSHATMLTGLYPRTHRVVKNAIRLKDSVTTLTEVLAENGYSTHAVVSSFILDRQFGLNQGFDTYDDRFTLEGSSMAHREFDGYEVESTSGFDQRAADATDKSLEVIQGAEAPFFLFVHYMDPHGPYIPPEPYLSMFLQVGDLLEHVIGRYDGEVAYTDAQIGRLLDSLPENTLVIFTADHGEGLMDHGIMSHGFDLYEEQVRVPLILSWKEVLPEGGRVQEPAELTQIVPTVLELTQIETDLEFDGTSLLKDLDAQDPVYLHRRHYGGVYVDDYDLEELKPYRTNRNYKPSGRKYGIRVGDHKFIQGGQDGPDELYNLESDPEERLNRRDDAPEVRASLSNALDAWLEATEPTAPARERELSPEDEEALEALGYFQ